MANVRIDQIGTQHTGAVDDTMRVEMQRADLSGCWGRPSVLLNQPAATARLGLLGVSADHIVSNAAATIGGDLLLHGDNRVMMGNLYYSGGWKYTANGYGGYFQFPSTGGVTISTVGQNSGGAGAAASPAIRVAITVAGDVVPGADNAQKLGNGGARWSELHCVGLGVGIAPNLAASSQAWVNGDITLNSTGRAVMGNLYYEGGWKYTGDGTGSAIVTNPDGTNAFVFYVAPLNSSGSGAAATPVAALIIPASNGDILPGGDNIQKLGDGSNRWSVVYAATGTINTSDPAEKQDMRPFSEAELAAARDFQFVAYRWKDAVGRKGKAARIHFGFDARQVLQTLKAYGIDPDTFAGFCRDPIIRRVKKTRPVERVKRESVEIEETREEIDGERVVRRVYKKTIERDVTRALPLVDDKGAAIMEFGAIVTGADGKPLLDRAGQPTRRMVAATRHVPVMETVEEEYEADEDTGETRMSLRHDYLFALKIAALEAAT